MPFFRSKKKELPADDSSALQSQVGDLKSEVSRLHKRLESMQARVHRAEEEQRSMHSSSQLSSGSTNGPREIVLPHGIQHASKEYRNAPLPRKKKTKKQRWPKNSPRTVRVVRRPNASRQAYVGQKVLSQLQSTPSLKPTKTKATRSTLLSAIRRRLFRWRNSTRPTNTLLTNTCTADQTHQRPPYPNSNHQPPVSTIIIPREIVVPTPRVEEPPKRHPRDSKEFRRQLADGAGAHAQIELETERQRCRNQDVGVRQQASPRSPSTNLANIPAKKPTVPKAKYTSKPHPPPLQLEQLYQTADPSFKRTGDMHCSPPRLPPAVVRVSARSQERFWKEEAPPIRHVPRRRQSPQAATFKLAIPQEQADETRTRPVQATNEPTRGWHHQEERRPKTGYKPHKTTVTRKSPSQLMETPRMFTQQASNVNRPTKPTRPQPAVLLAEIRSAGGQKPKTALNKSKKPQREGKAPAPCGRGSIPGNRGSSKPSGKEFESSHKVTTSRFREATPAALVRLDCTTASTEQSSSSLSSEGDQDPVVEEPCINVPPRVAPQFLLQPKSIVSKWNKFADMEERGVAAAPRHRTRVATQTQNSANVMEQIRLQNHQLKSTEHAPPPASAKPKSPTTPKDDLFAAIRSGIELRTVKTVKPSSKEKEANSSPTSALLAKLQARKRECIRRSQQSSAGSNNDDNW